MIDINSAVTVEKIAGTDFATGLLLKRLVPLYRMFPHARKCSL